MFDADKPIIQSSQDRLNRTVFAKYLARCMLDHKDSESLVIGLYGGWGVGKTSVINLVLQELNFASSNMPDEEKPIVLNFSPWSYSGQNELIYSFFRRLSSALRNVDYLENADKIIHLLELYVSFFTHKPIPKSLRTPRSFFSKLTFQGREDVYGWESGRDLTLVKAELNECLRNQKHKIVVIIDNISRLYDYEIKQIFQIVKSMGDYANTMYVLALDKKQIIHAINKMDGGGGEDFIEKIVQLPFDIPPILQQDLENILSDKLGEVISLVPEGAWDKAYWADMYYSSLKLFFDTCRDITRYVNTLHFSYSRLRDMVNPVDFFALTAIEVFAPPIYSGIRSNKDLFTDLFDKVYTLDKEQMKKDRTRCDEILSRSTRISRENMLRLLMKMFPRIRHIYNPETPFFHSDMIARKCKRICSPDLFDMYFRLSMQTGQIPQSEFETILSLASNEVAFNQAMTGLNKDERISQFLDLLDNPLMLDLPLKHIQTVVSALLNNGDLFPPGSGGPLRLDTAMRIHRIIHELLHRFDQPEERFLILQNAIANAKNSLFILVNELREEGREHLEEDYRFAPLPFRDLTPDQLQSLRHTVVQRIENWAHNGSLVQHPQLLSILYAWQDWGNRLACQHYVEEITQSDRGLLSFLTSALDKAINQAMTEYQKNPAWNKYLENINAFIPAHHLEAHAKALFEDAYFEKLSEREQLALMIFLDLMKSNTNKSIPHTTV